MNLVGMTSMINEKSHKLNFGLLFAIVLLIISCKTETKKAVAINEDTTVVVYETIGHIERLDLEINGIIPKGAKIEVLSDTLKWAEGPLWIPEKKWLLCSDVKQNKIFKWSEQGGMELYLDNSGFQGTNTDSRERGSNGLTLDKESNLVICQHGNRQVVQLNTALENPTNDFKVLASHYNDNRFNSPNDLVFDSKGNLYFTDPPYGLSEAMMEDPNKELPFQGIYRLSKAGELQLLSDKISRPNGLAFNPDETKLYVANTDGDNASWVSFPILENGDLGEAEVILNVTHLIGKEVGFPDGIKVDNKGNIFTAGPGGLWIFNRDFEVIGKIKPGKWVSNCAFNEDYSTLYITADDALLRVQLK